MPDPEPLTLQNKQRLIVPLICLPILALMFVPIFLLLDFEEVDSVKVALGISTFILLFGWLALSAWRAPFEATFGNQLTVRKLMRSRDYSHDMIRRWRFLHPHEPPSQNPPTENGLIEIKLDDGTTFKAEVDRNQAERVKTWLGRTN